jgi:hypothetical protein
MQGKLIMLTFGRPSIQTQKKKSNLSTLPPPRSSVVRPSACPAPLHCRHPPRRLHLALWHTSARRHRHPPQHTPSPEAPLSPVAPCLSVVPRRGGRRWPGVGIASCYQAASPSWAASWPELAILVLCAASYGRTMKNICYKPYVSSVSDVS